MSEITFKGVPLVYKPDFGEQDGESYIGPVTLAVLECSHEWVSRPKYGLDICRKCKGVRRPN